MKKRKKIQRINGRAEAARARVLKAAKRAGRITSHKAMEIGEWKQGWYHLEKLRQAGLLKHAGHNEWKPTRRAWR